MTYQPDQNAATPENRRNTNAKSYIRTLTIAGSDSGGGAGIQADLKTFSALGCYGTSAITALTAQNTVGVQDIHPVPPEFIGRQIDSVAEDIGVDAVKIGMLHDKEVIDMVAGKLEEHQLRNVVLDPVMVAQSGDVLIREQAIEVMLQRLIPNADVITPNLPEAARLLGYDTGAAVEAEPSAGRLLETGCGAVLVKGGHGSDEHARDCLAVQSAAGGHPQTEWYSSPRINTPNTHGTGCTLSSAIAAYLGRGFNMFRAVQYAKRYITSAIEAGAEYRIGEGSGPLHHFCNLWNYRAGNAHKHSDSGTQ